MSDGKHVDLDTVAKYCSRAGLGSVLACKRWLRNEFNAKGKVTINGASLGGYKDANGNWWCRTKRVALVFGLTPAQANGLRGSAAARRVPKFPAATKKLRKGECVTCQGACRLRTLIEMDADLAWDGKPNAALTAELVWHKTATRAMTVHVRRKR